MHDSSVEVRSKAEIEADKKKDQERKEALVKQSKRNHRPGLQHTLPDGTVYAVSKTGAWCRTSARPALVAHLKDEIGADNRHHNNGARRRKGRV